MTIYRVEWCGVVYTVEDLSLSDIETLFFAASLRAAYREAVPRWRQKLDRVIVWLRGGGKMDQVYLHYDPLTHVQYGDATRPIVRKINRKYQLHKLAEHPKFKPTITRIDE